MQEGEITREKEIDKKIERDKEKVIKTMYMIYRNLFVVAIYTNMDILFSVKSNVKSIVFT